MAALDSTFGMLFIGLILTSCLYGITVVQTYNYFRGYPRDTIYLKAMVGLVMLLDTAGMACAAQGMYWYLVTHYGDPSTLPILDKTFCIETLISVFVAFLVQCFFARSVWKVSKKNRIVTGIISITAFAALVSGAAMAIEGITQGLWVSLAAKRFSILAGLDLGIAAICDLTITASLCYYFHFHKGGFKKTDTLLDKLIIFTINRGVVTFIIQTLNIIFFIGIPDKLIWGPFHLILSKVYTITLLATLNRRDGRKTDVMTVDTLQFKSGSIGTETFRTELPTQTSSIRTYDPNVVPSKGTVGEGTLA